MRHSDGGNGKLGGLVRLGDGRVKNDTISESVDHSEQRKEAYRANVEISGLNKWKRGASINNQASP